MTTPALLQLRIDLLEMTMANMRRADDAADVARERQRELGLALMHAVKSDRRSVRGVVNAMMAEITEREQCEARSHELFEESGRMLNSIKADGKAAGLLKC